MNIFVTGSFLIFMVIIMAAYFSREKVSSYETNVYTYLLITMVFGLLIEGARYLILESFGLSSMEREINIMIVSLVIC